MSATAEPTVVIVPGGWTTASGYEPLIKAFSSRLYQTVFSVSTIAESVEVNASTSINPDAKHLREKVLIPLVENEEKDVALLMHSYGGIYGPSTVQGLSKKERGAAGKKGGVVALIFFAGFTAKKGMSATDTMGVNPENPPEWLSHDKTTGLVRFTQARELLYHNLPDEEAEKLAAELPPHPFASFMTKPQYDPYDDPMFTGRFGYIFTQADRILPLTAQEIFAKNGGVSESLMLKDTGHSAHLERPGDLAEVVIEMIEKLEKNGSQAE